MNRMDKPIATLYYGGFFSRTGGAFMHVCMMTPGLEKLVYSVQVVTLDTLQDWLLYPPHFVEKIVNAFRAPMRFAVKGRLTSVLFHLNAKLCALRMFEDICLGTRRSPR
jgi:hypothetical protein